MAGGPQRDRGQIEKETAARAGSPGRGTEEQGFRDTERGPQRPPHHRRGQMSVTRMTTAGAHRGFLRCKMTT